MACRVIHNWTFSGLVGAFLDLVIAYLLLCASTVAFFASKFLGIFGLCLPCPCNGLFGNPNRNYCAQRLLLDCPIGQVSSVQFSTKNKFPFDSIFAKDQNLDPNMKLIGDGSNNVDGFVEFEREASCSSISGARKSQIVVGKESVETNQNYVKERRFDGKGKGVINQRLKGVVRRRRKGGLDEGKLSSTGSTRDLVCVNPQGFSQSICSTIEEENVAVQGEPVPFDASQCYYEEEAPTAVKSGERALDDEIKPNELKGDEENSIVVLKQKLEEEHAARAALYLELEEERNAAATAADEAMAMILRLQEEKASIEMEARQYQRMIEEKADYDLEEMNILKEILLRREREKHFLQKEVEAYRRMNDENEEFEGDFRDPHEDPSRMLHQLSKSIDMNPIRGWDEYGNGSKQEKNLEREFSHVLKCISDCNQELHEKKMISVENEVKILEASSQEHKQGQNGQSVVSEEEVRVHDVHVIDVNRDSPSTSMTETEMTTSGLPPIGPRGVSVISHLRRNSTSAALDTERLKIESEVGWLRERLKVVQEGREKLNLSVEYREREKLQLQLLEDIVLQLQEIRQWTSEPEKAVRQVSLPLPSSKIISKKKRCRSVSLGVDKSA